MGLLAEAKWALSRGFCSSDVVERLEKILLNMRLPTRVFCSKEALILAINQDKKMCRAKLLIPVPVGIGEIRLDFIDPSELRLAAEMVSGEV